MMTHHRNCRAIALAIAWGWTAAPAFAQATPPSLADVKARVRLGDVVYVTDATRGTIKGTLSAITDDAVDLNVGGGVRRVAAADVRRIERRQPDSLLDGVLIGAAAGAVPGIYWLVVDPNECTGMCPEEYAGIAVGALVGGLIDRAITSRVTVYPLKGGSASVTLGPLLSRDRKGVRVAVRF